MRAVPDRRACSAFQLRREGDLSGYSSHASQLWPFVQGMQKPEVRCFRCRLHGFGKKIKGGALLGRDAFKFAGQRSLFPRRDPRRLCRSFLEKGRRKAGPGPDEFTSCGQACLRMAEGVFEPLDYHGAVLTASAIPRGVVRSPRPPLSTRRRCPNSWKRRIWQARPSSRKNEEISSP